MQRPSPESSPHPACSTPQRPMNLPNEEEAPGPHPSAQHLLPRPGELQLPAEVLLTCSAQAPGAETLVSRRDYRPEPNNPQW